MPVEDLEAVLARDRHGVLLPREEFEKLYEAARQNAPGRTPDALVLSSANYTARISGEQLLIDARIEFTNFATGWTQLVIPAGRLGVEQSSLDNGSARLARHPEHADQLVLYVDEPGPHTLTLELSTPLNAVGSDQAAGFSLPGAPSGEMTLTLPSGKFLAVDGLQPQRPAPEDQPAEYHMPIGGRAQIALRITDRQREGVGETLVFANTTFRVAVAPGEVTWQAQTSLQVYGRAIDRLVCRVPDALEITGVESTGLESWELADDPAAPGRTMITLLFRQPFDGTRDVTFRGVVSQSADETWSVPNLELENITSHVGLIILNHPPGVRVQPQESRGVRPIAPIDPKHAATALKFEVWEPDFNLTFRATSKERDVHVAMTNVLDINAAGLDLYTTLGVQTLFAPLFEARLRLPAGWTMTSVASTAPFTIEAADWQVVPVAAGVNEVRIPLPAPLTEGQSLNLSLTAHQDLEDWPPEDATVGIPLPDVVLPQAGVVEALYGVTADDDLDVLPGNISGLDPARADDVALLNSKLQSLGKQVRLGFTYQDTVFTGQLDVARKPSRVAVATVTFFRVDRETLFAHLEAHLHIEGGGERTLQVAVSESAGTDLRFQLVRPMKLIEQQRQQGLSVPFDTVRIVEQTPSDPAVGMRTWTLQLDRRARGDLVLLVNVQQPRAGEGPYEPYVLNVLNADRQSGHIAVEAGSEQHVQITATGDDGLPLQTVDPVDFPPAFYRPAERVVAGYQYVRPGWTLSVSETRYERSDIPTAVIHSANLQSVLSPEGHLQNQADLDFTAIGIQSLKLTFAESGAQLWAALIDGAPVEVRDAGDAYLVTLPPTDSPAQRRTLTLFYQTQVPPLDESGELQQRPPEVTAITGSGTEQPIDILEQQWTLYHSPDTLIVDSEGSFHPLDNLDRASLLGRLQQGLQAPSPTEVAVGLLAVLGAAVVIFVLALGFRSFRWWGTFVACGIIGIVLIALLLPSVQQSREAARRTQSRNNLHQIGLAFHNFHDVAGTFPAGGTFDQNGRPMHSWETQLLPYIDQAPLYNQIDLQRPWNDPVNAPHFRTPVPPYLQPTDALPRTVNGFAASHYAGNRYVLLPNAPMSVRQVTDGTSNTLLAGEVAGGVKAWGDPTNTRDPATGIGSGAFQFGRPTGEGALMLMMDGSVKFVSADIDRQTLLAMATPAGNDVIGEFDDVARAGSPSAGIAGPGEAMPTAEAEFEQSEALQQLLVNRNELLQAETTAQNRVDQIQSGPFDGAESTPEAAAEMPAEPGRPPAPAASPTTSPEFDAHFGQGTDLSVPQFAGFQATPPLAQAPAGQQGQQAGVDGTVSYTRSGGYTRAPVARGALLSLIIQLQPPDDAIARTFRYYGTAGADAATLDVTYADRTGGGMLTLLIAAALTLFCWMLRRRSIAFRAKLAALVIAGPLGLMSVAPAASLPILDGLFLGGIFAVVLWSIRACAPGSRQWWQSCCGKSPAATTKTTTVATALLFALLIHGNVRAQDSEPPPTTHDSPLTPIIIPYKSGTDPTTAERVFLPQKTFLRLWNQAHPEDRRTGPAPLHGVISEALYVAQLVSDGDEPRVSVTGRYLLHNLSHGQITLPLPVGNVAVQSAILDGASAPLIVSEASIAVVIDQPGPHVLDLKFDVPARITGPAGQFTLPLKPIAAGRLSFTLPDGENLLVRVGGATGSYRLVEDGNLRSVEAPVADGGDVTVSWQPKQTQAAIEGIVHVDAATAVKIDDAGLHLSTGLQYSVPQGSLTEAAFTLPANLALQSISGPDVGGWEVADDAGNRTLRVFFRRGIDEQTQLTINLFQSLPVADAPVAFDVPEVVPQNVTREIGVLALYAAEHFTLRVDQADGLTQTNFDRFTAPVMPSAPVYDPPNARFAYRYTMRPIRISATVARREAETRAVAEHAANVGLRKLIVASRIQFELTGAPRPSVSIAIPDGYLPVDVTGTFLSDWYVTESDGGRVLTVELGQPRTGHVEVRLEGHFVKQPDAATFAVPLPDPLEVSRLQSSLAIWLDPAYTASLQEFDNWRSIDPQQLSEAVQALQSRAAQFAFRSDQANPADVVLNLSRATPDLAADAITLIAVSDASVDYGVNLRWKITRAAADTFVLVTPDWLQGRLELHADGIRQITSEATGDGRLRWTISLVDPVRDQFLLNGVATLPPPEDKQVLAPGLQFEQPGDAGTFDALETQSQFVVLVNLSSSQITPVDIEAHESIPADQLPLQVSQQLVNQAMEIVRVAEGAVPVWQMERLELAAAANATVTGAALTTVLDYDGSWRMQAVYTVRNRGRQFLALKLPTDAKLLSVFVRGQPSRTVKTELGNDNIQLVALPQTSAADLSFDVRLVLTGRLGQSLPEHFGVLPRSIALPAPSVVSPEEAADAGQPDLGMPVVQTQWTVHLPRDIDGSPDETNLTDTGDAALFRLQQLESDVAALKRGLLNPYTTASQRVRAANNLKQLQIESHNLDQSMSMRGVRLQGESYARNEDLQREIEEALTQSSAATSKLPVDAQTASDQELGRNYILGNNADINVRNRFGRGEEKAGEVGGLNFNSLDDTQVLSDLVTDENLAKESRDRGELRRQIEQQSIVTDGSSNTFRQGGARMTGGRAIGGAMGGIGGGGFAPQPGETGQPMVAGPGPGVIAQPESREMNQFYSDFAIPAQAGGMDVDADGDGILGAAEVALPAWTSAGGLSLDMSIPTTENTLTFSKVGGQPELSLNMRPRKTLTLGIGALWTVLWIVVGIWAARVLARAGAAGHTARALPRILIALGLLGFFLLPAPARWFAFALFVMATLVYAFQHHRPAAST